MKKSVRSRDLCMHMCVTATYVYTQHMLLEV